MAVSFQVSDILADVAYHANVPPFTTDTRTTLAQATRMVVQAARTVSAELARVFGEDNDFLRTATLTVPANVGLASLPSRCHQLHAVVWVKSSTDSRIIEPASPERLEVYEDAQAWADCRTPTYQLEGETLAFYPVSSAEETIQLFYYTDLGAVSDTVLNTRIDVDLWITLTVAKRVLDSEPRDSSVVANELLLVDSKLFASGRKKDTTGNPTIRNVRGRGRR